MSMREIRSTHGWAHVSEVRKRELIAAITARGATPGPVHAELDLTDRCNVACYFCNQQDTRSKLQVPETKAIELIDELVAGGLRSVRLSGGGDPLHHRDILAILDHLRGRGVVVDHLTTNGVALGPEVIERLIAHEARELHVSLNAVDGPDYKRMMAVKEDRFDRVLENLRTFVECRGERPLPSLTVQFLLDRVNAERVLEMYQVGLDAGADRICFGAVLEVPFERVDAEVLLNAADAERLVGIFEELFRRDRERGLVEAQLFVAGLDDMVHEAQRRAEAVRPSPFATAPAFRDRDGGCFFAWYSTTVTGNGNLYPCCLLIHPDTVPLGNIHQGDFASQWHGPGYRKLRSEMRRVLVEGADREHDAAQYEQLKPICLEPQLCWLKNGYFRADEAFYRELGAALDELRARERRSRWWRASARALRAGVHSAYRALCDRSRPARTWLKRTLKLPLTKAA